MDLPLRPNRASQCSLFRHKEARVTAPLIYSQRSSSAVFHMLDVLWISGSAYRLYRYTGLLLATSVV